MRRENLPDGDHDKIMRKPIRDHSRVEPSRQRNPEM